MNTSTHAAEPSKLPGNLLAMRQEIINDVATSKTKFEHSLDRLKKYDDFLRASGIEIPRTTPDFQTKPGSSQTARTSTNGTNGVHTSTQARSTETIVKPGRKGKRGARKGKLASKTRNGGAKAARKVNNGGAKAARKVNNGGDARKVKAKAGRKAGKERNGGLRAKERKGDLRKGQGSAKKEGQPKLTLKEAMCKVIGKRVMRTEEVFEGLKQLGIVPNSQDPKRHVGYTLSSEPKIFPRVPEKGKGYYRADPSQLPQRRGGGRRPGSTTASAVKTGGKEADSSESVTRATKDVAAKPTVNAAAAAAIDPTVEDAGEKALRDLGYDPQKDPALFGRTAAG